MGGDEGCDGLVRQLFSLVHGAALYQRARDGNPSRAPLSIPAMGYALAAPMSDLVACPFCRQLFEPAEASACPDCGLGLKDLGKLPPSYDAKIEYPEEPVPPHMETLPWTYLGRNRALLLGLAILGVAAFFMPWVHETAPELRTLSGFGLAKLSGF